jgi:hypothetical protein
MACPPSKVKFQFRRDTLCNWSINDPILQAGEPAFESDTNSFKIGDGITKWKSLPYIQSPLVFTQSGNVRTLTGYKESGQVLAVRSTDLTGNMLNINLASFNPILSAQGIPSNFLNWDVPSTGFSVSVINPSDYTNEYINGVSSTTVITGIFSILSNFTASAKSNTPGGGISWTQTFSTNASAFIRPISNSIIGGVSSSSILFNVIVGDPLNNCITIPPGGTPSGSVYGSPVVITINWNTPTTSISTTPLSGKTFLDTYTSTAYTVSVTGMSNSSNYSFNISSIGGLVSNISGGGIFTFTIPIHKDNTSIPRSVTTLTTFNRPANVTGTAYATTLTATANVTSIFLYPSFWLFTIGTPSPPTVTDIINGANFSPGVTTLGDKANTLNTFINNTSGSPKGFWFAVLSSVSQPTVFKSGTSPSLISDVAVTFGNTVNLQPTPAPVGYIPVTYTLYGITLQNGSTYISIV